MTWKRAKLSEQDKKLMSKKIYGAIELNYDNPVHPESGEIKFSQDEYLRVLAPANASGISLKDQSSPDKPFNYPNVGLFFDLHTVNPIIFVNEKIT